MPIRLAAVAAQQASLDAGYRWIDRERAILESLTVIRRAGADIVLTYWAAEVAQWLASGRAGVMLGQRAGSTS